MSWTPDRDFAGARPQSGQHHTRFRLTQSEKDKDILEYVANDAPWHIVCGAMHDEFIRSEELIERIFNLYNEGLLEIQKDPYKKFPQPLNCFEKRLRPIIGLTMRITLMDTGGISEQQILALNS